MKTAPKIQFTDSVVLIRPGQQAQLHASVDNGSTSYSWQPAADLENANTLDPLTVPLLESKYSVSV